MVWDCMKVLEKLTRSNTVTLVWIPKHHGNTRKWRSW